MLRLNGIIQWLAVPERIADLGASASRPTYQVRLTSRASVNGSISTSTREQVPNPGGHRRLPGPDARAGRRQVERHMEWSLCSK